MSISCKLVFSGVVICALFAVLSGIATKTNKLDVVVAFAFLVTNLTEATMHGSGRKLIKTCGHIPIVAENY